MEVGSKIQMSHAEVVAPAAATLVVNVRGRAERIDRLGYIGRRKGERDEAARGCQESRRAWARGEA